MGQAELLKELRQKTGIIEYTEREFWKAPDLPSGVAQGIIVELLGNARTEWLLSFFRMNPEHLIFWCEREIKANPTAIHQRGVKLERIKFVQCEGSLQQPLRLALESGRYPFIIAPNRFTDITTFQRFHLLAEKSKSTLFLMGEQNFSPAWPISLQIEIQSSPTGGFELVIQRQRHGAVP